MKDSSRTVPGKWRSDLLGYRDTIIISLIISSSSSSSSSSSCGGGGGSSIKDAIVSIMVPKET
jgi:hypothetical protein